MWEILCTKVGERETRQKSISLLPNAGKLASLAGWVGGGGLGGGDAQTKILSMDRG